MRRRIFELHVKAHSSLENNHFALTTIALDRYVVVAEIEILSLEKYRLRFGKK